MDPGNEIINSSMGDIKFYYKDYPAAIHFYKRAVQINPAYADVWYRLGLCHELLGNMPEAVNCFLKCIELSPGNSNYITSLAFAYLITGKYDQSKDLLLQSVEIDPGMAINYYYIACLYSIQGKNDEGFKWLEKAFEKGFDNFEYLQADPYLENLRRDEGYEEMLIKYKRE